MIFSTEKEEKDIIVFEMRKFEVIEVFWRLYEYPLHTQYPKVYILDIHLDDQKQIYFEDGNIMQDLMDQHAKITQLMSFFELNQGNEVNNR